MVKTKHGRRIGALVAMAVLGYAVHVAVGLGSAFGHLHSALEGGYGVRIEPGPAAAAPAQPIQSNPWLPAAAAPVAVQVDESGPAGQDAGDLRRQALEDLVNEDREFAALAWDADPAVRGALRDFFED